MRMIIPQTIAESDIENVTEAAEWSAFVNYVVGDLVERLGVVYVCVVDNLNKPPESNGSRWETIPAHINEHGTNGDLSDSTNFGGDIEFTLTIADVIVNGLAFFGLSGNTMTVYVDDDDEGRVYENTFNLQDQSDIGNWHDYFFKPVSSKAELAVVDLPSYLNASIGVQITGSLVAFSEMVAGFSYDLGQTLFNGTGVSITDFSTSENGNITAERQQKNVTYNAIVADSKVPAVINRLSDRLGLPTVYLADQSRLELLTYGFFKDFDIQLEDHNNTLLKIEIEGLTL